MHVEPNSIDAWLALGRLLVDAAWPIATVVLVLAFRKQIAGLIPRVTKLPGGTELAEPIQQPTTAAEERATSGTISTKSDSAITQIAAAFEPAIREQFVDSIDGELTGMANSSEKLDYLKRALAVARRGATYQAIARSIFGSQLELLARGSASALGADIIESIYQIYRSRLVNGTPMTKAVWLNYPKHHSLVVGDENHLEVTARGRDFVAFSTSVLGETPTNKPL